MSALTRKSINSIQRKRGGEVVCQEHDDSAIVMFCRTCDQLVCDSCIKDSHKPHDLEAISKQMIEDRVHLSQQIPLVKTSTMPALKEHVKTIAQNKDKSGKDFEELVNKIISRTAELIKMIEKSRDHMIQMCRKDQERARNFLSNLEENMAQGIKSLEQSIADAEQVIKAGNAKGADVIQSRLKLQWDIQEYKKRHAQIEIPEFVSGTLYDNSIDKLIGVFSGGLHLKTREEVLSKTLKRAKPLSSWKVRPTLVAALPLKYDLRSASTVKNDTLLMVPVTRKRLLITMSANGQTRETEMSDHRIYDMSQSIGSEFVATDADNKKVLKFKLDGSVVEAHQLNSIPRGVHVCKNGEVLMCLCDSIDFRNLKGKQKIVRLNEKLEMQDSDDLNEVEFTVPDRIYESDNGDICVIDRIGGGHSRLCVLNKDGSLKFTFPPDDAAESKKKFSLSDVCSDSFSNIFVSDEKNNDVYVLNSNGEEITRFSKILKKKSLHIVAPNRIVLDRTSKLWIVMPGKVLVFDLYI